MAAAPDPVSGPPASAPPAPGGGPTRRTVLRAGLSAGAAAGAGPLLSGCFGFDTTGGGGGRLVFLSSQFIAVEEGQRFRRVLRESAPAASFSPAEPSAFATRVATEVESGRVGAGVIGALYGELAQFAPDRLEDLSDVAARLSGNGYTRDMLELARFGTDRTYFIPWMQATYILAVNKKALEHLPPGADVDNLTYDQFLAWAREAAAKNGRPVFGLPGGPKGLLHRFIQGHLYPSFTGGQITTFRSEDAVRMWEYVRELWPFMVPASTTFEFMQEPLASGQVQVAWDHVARLAGAPAAAPDGFLMVPAPAGPKGRGYMSVLAGLAIPKGAPRQAEGKKLIEALSRPAIQLDVLRENAFFPAVRTPIPRDLPIGVRLQARAVDLQQRHGLLALPPARLGTQDGEMSAAFRNAFTGIVLDGDDIRATLGKQAKAVQELLDGARAPCWRPDPDSGGRTCRVA
jgi:multiple sugar transport system substrate-binding protein